MAKYYAKEKGQQGEKELSITMEKRDNRRRRRQDLEPTAPPHTGQENQDNDGPPPPKRARLESATAAGARDPEDLDLDPEHAEQPEDDAGEPEAVGMMGTSPSKQCSGCNVVRPVTDFPWKPQRRTNHGQPRERAKTCWPCKVRRDNRRRPMQEGGSVQINQINPINRVNRINRLKGLRPEARNNRRRTQRANVTARRSTATALTTTPSGFHSVYTPAEPGAPPWSL
ncbi:hypothetical protein E4U47_001760, partial [Claviceps purpurea]